MNREILFRGKIKGGNRWVYGDFISPNSIRMEICDAHGHESHIDFPIDPETVGQYTGLKDMNGVKIFEGDEIGIWRVVWSSHEMGWLCETHEGDEILLIDFDESIEVTGNIHED